MPPRVEEQLLTYVASELLAGKGHDLTPETPLLELGIIDSFTVLKVLAFAEREWGTTIPIELVSAQDMKDIASIARLIARRAAEEAPYNPS